MRTILTMVQLLKCSCHLDGFFNSLTAFEVEPLSNNDNLPGNNSKASPVSMLVVYVSFQLNTNENKNTTKIVEIDNLIAT